MPKVMTPMMIAMSEIAEIIEGLKAAGLSEKAALRFAAIVFTEQAADVDDEPDTDAAG
jgi:hypothetical protein